jgi:hypothetical protein
MIFLRKFEIEFLHLRPKEVLPFLLIIDFIQNLHVLILKTSHGDLSSHILVALLNLVNDLVVSLIELLKEGSLEILLILNESCKSIKPVSMAELMGLVAFTLLTTAVERDLLALLIGADVVNCISSLALELRLRDGLQNR